MHNHDKEEIVYLIGCSVLIFAAGVIGMLQSDEEPVRPVNVASTTAYVREAPIFTTTNITTEPTTTTTTTTTTPVTTTETTTMTDEPIFVEPEQEVVYEYVEEPVIFEEPITEAPVSEIIVETEPAITEATETVYSYSATDDEIMLIARVAECEAGHVEEGRRYVIDTILNRVDSPDFPNSISGVIYQRGQFSVVNSGAIWNVSISDDRLDLVKAELTSRTNYEVGYFRAGYYGPYGTPLFECGGNYFSSIN